MFVEVPDDTWDDVDGLEDTEERPQETVQWPLEYLDSSGEWALRPVKGVLLYGRPGQSNFILIKSPKFLNMYVESPRRVSATCSLRSERIRLRSPSRMWLVSRRRIDRISSTSRSSCPAVLIAARPRLGSSAPAGGHDVNRVIRDRKYDRITADDERLEPPYAAFRTSCGPFLRMIQSSNTPSPTTIPPAETAAARTNPRRGFLARVPSTESADETESVDDFFVVTCLTALNALSITYHSTIARRIPVQVAAMKVKNLH